MTHHLMIQNCMPHIDKEIHFKVTVHSGVSFLIWPHMTVLYITVTAATEWHFASKYDETKQPAIAPEPATKFQPLSQIARTLPDIHFMYFTMFSVSQLCSFDARMTGYWKEWGRKHL
jgi:hypothetical protein